ncbi:PQQ-binding-like beta-propeller repeat protein [soil metagenome]
MKLRAATIAGFATLVLAGGLAGLSWSQQGPANTALGATTFDVRCKRCHDPAITRAPNLEQLRGRTTQDIVEALMRGVMQPQAVGMTPAEINAVAAFLTGHAAPPPGSGGAGAPRAPAPTPAAQVSYDPAPASVTTTLLGKLRSVSRAMLHRPAPGDWLRWGRTDDGQGFSPLNQVNRGNVAGLRQAWRTPLQPGPSMPTPIVHDGVMFLQTNPDTVLALDATSGKLLWRQTYAPVGPSSQKMGIALADDRVFVPTSDLHVIALNARTGQKTWDHTIELSAPATDRTQFQLRSAPIVVGDKVIQGVTGSGAPGGGFIVALDIVTGREVWRFHTIPRLGQPGDNTWNGLALDKRSGASVWDQGTYDPELNLVYFGVGQTYDTAPLNQPSGAAGTNQDSLYTDSTLALDPNTGRLVWHYQHLKNDQWDLDWVFERQLVTMKAGGKTRRVVTTIGKMGILDALDAKTGAYLFSIDAGAQNVITAIDPKTGAKTTDPLKWPDPSRTALICPTMSGARAWPTTSFSPRTGLVYVPITEWCLMFGPQGARLLSAPGARFSNADHPDATKDGMMGRVTAMDLAGHRLGWSHDLPAPVSTSVMATAGGVVFAGDLDPALKAFDDRDGKLLWTGQLDAFPSSNLITYSVGATQYVAVVIGMTNNQIGDLSRRYQAFQRTRGVTPVRPTGAPAIVVFALERRGG